MSKLKEDWVKEASDLGISLNKEVEGKEVEKTIEDLQADIEAAQAAADKKAPKKSKSKKAESIKILLPVAGKYFLPYNIGQVVKIGKGGIEAKQAAQLVEDKYAEKV